MYVCVYVCMCMYVSQNHSYGHVQLINVICNRTISALWPRDIY